MTANLNLIKSQTTEIEKRIFPRFPFSFMIFKEQDVESEQAYEVIDISLTGMQISLKNGGHTLNNDHEIKGELHWKGVKLNVVGKVKWVTASNIGIAFSSADDQRQRIQEFLSIDNIINSMKALHKSDLGLEIPRDLKYWLRADGPFEVFLWQHNDGELAKFQVIMMNNFIEWEDGKGVRTGNVIKRRDIDSPLNQEDEFIFEIDNVANESKVNSALGLCERIPETYLPQQAVEFLCVKLGGNPVSSHC